MLLNHACNLETVNDCFTVFMNYSFQFACGPANETFGNRQKQSYTESPFKMQFKK